MTSDRSQKEVGGYASPDEATVTILKAFPYPSFC